MAFGVTVMAVLFGFCGSDGDGTGSYESHESDESSIESHESELSLSSLGDGVFGSVGLGILVSGEAVPGDFEVGIGTGTPGAVVMGVGVDGTVVPGAVVGVFEVGTGVEGV